MQVVVFYPQIQLELRQNDIFCVMEVAFSFKWSAKFQKSKIRLNHFARRNEFMTHDVWELRAQRVKTDLVQMAHI